MTSGPPAATPIDPACTVLVVIPTYNERANLPVCVGQVLALDPRYRVLVVDDGSPDGTGDIADELARDFPERVCVLHRARKEGLGRAYVAGLGLALETGTPLIVQMDADLSHRPEDLPALVAALEHGDLALGSRYVAGGATVGWPWQRRLISRTGGFVASRVLGLPIRDLTSGFKAWRRETLAAIDLSTITSDGYSFQIETTYRAVLNGARVAQVPIVFHDRVAGKSKISRRVIAEAAVRVWAFRIAAWRQRDDRR